MPPTMRSAARTSTTHAATRSDAGCPTSPLGGPTGGSKAARRRSRRETRSRVVRPHAICSTTGPPSGGRSSCMALRDRQKVTSCMMWPTTSHSSSKAVAVGARTCSRPGSDLRRSPSSIAIFAASRRLAGYGSGRRRRRSCGSTAPLRYARWPAIPAFAPWRTRRSSPRSVFREAQTPAGRTTISISGAAGSCWLRSGMGARPRRSRGASKGRGGS